MAEKEIYRVIFEPVIDPVPRVPTRLFRGWEASVLQIVPTRLLKFLICPLEYIYVPLIFYTLF